MKSTKRDCTSKATHTHTRARVRAHQPKQQGPRERRQRKTRRKKETVSITMHSTAGLQLGFQFSQINGGLVTYNFYILFFDRVIRHQKLTHLQRIMQNTEKRTNKQQQINYPKWLSSCNGLVYLDIKTWLLIAQGEIGK